MKKEMQKILLRDLDKGRGAMLSARKYVRMPIQGWLKAVRNVLGLSQRELAGRMKIRQQAYANIESREPEGAVTLETLRRGADALDCELVYFLVPKNGMSFSKLARENSPDFRLLQASKHSMALEGQAVDEKDSGEEDA